MVHFLLDSFFKGGGFVELTPQEIETIKKAYDLIDVVASYGIKVHKKGANYAALCPFHEEKTPSFIINPKARLYHCFGCNAAGDVIGFVAKMEGIGFREAVKRLKGRTPDTREKATAKPPVPSNPVTRTKLLNRVVSFYHTTFFEDHRGMDYLKSRGITDNALFTDFRLGFSNGTLLNTIPDDGDITETLKEIGILNSKGHEFFYGSVVFPIMNENKDCVGIYARRITEGETAHLYLPGERKGVFNFQAAKRSTSLILTESIIDALTLLTSGFKDVIPCYGVNGLTDDHMKLFADCHTKEAYICFDRDDAGEKGTARLAGQLKERGIAPYIVRLPAIPDTDKVDINSFFLTADAPVIFESLLKSANPRTAIRSDRVVKHEQKHYEVTPTGFTVQYGDRRYELKGITKEGRLKATIKAITQKNDKRRFHLDTVDLYSNSRRLSFAKACAQLFAEKEETTLEDMARLIDLAEAFTPEKTEEAQAVISASDEQEALDFLKDPDLFDRILADFETIGVTGEDANKLMGYLAATSRKLDDPLSVLIQSRSAAGKSTLQDAIISLIPTEDAVKYTRLTGQALFYKEEDSLVHKLLAIEEEHGARDASYSIRNIQSSKHLSIAATIKDPVTGKLKTEEYKVKGPVALMITTTEVDLDYETSNRFITLTIDESKEMTERILTKQREQETLEGLMKKAETDIITRRHHNAQRLLRPLSVINPYAEHLTFPSDSLRARRDHKKYLGLIKAIAYLCQYQREIKTLTASPDRGRTSTGGTSPQSFSIEYIEVDLADIEKANTLAGAVLGQCLDELSPPSRLLLRMIHEMVTANSPDPREYHFTRKDIRDYTRWSDFQIKCHIRQLEDLEYLYSTAGKKGKEYVYELLYNGQGDDGRPFLMGLTTVEQLKEKVAESSTTRRAKT
jgi:DNA primase